MLSLNLKSLVLIIETGNLSENQKLLIGEIAVKAGAEFVKILLDLFLVEHTSMTLIFLRIP